ncbi:MAG: hypothetical protein U0Z44_04220 [Kouleothrix sp.]
MIIAKDEARHIGAALDSVAGAAGERLVLDARTCDDTAAICSGPRRPRSGRAVARLFTRRPSATVRSSYARTRGCCSSMPTA